MLNEFGIKDAEIYHNLLPSMLYEHAIKFENGSVITSTGALSARSGEKTGRSPKDKRIVKHPESEADVNWGDVNIPITEEGFTANKQRAIEYFKKQKKLYVFDVFASWDKSCQLKVRVICSRPYHALFVSNMFILPTQSELENFGQPDCIIYNAGVEKADENVPGVTSKSSICLNLEAKEIVILGTEYAGEMKKGIFTIMNYLMPKRNILSMHCSVTEGNKGDVSILLGLSGTGKTTLSADPHRKLIGDDEHCWSDNGIFNIDIPVIFNIKELTLVIYNSNGQVVSSQIINKTYQTGEIIKEQFDISNQSNGNYYIQIRSDTRILLSQIVILKI